MKKEEVNPKIYDLVRCPVTQEPLVREGDYLVARHGAWKYPLKNGIPYLLLESVEVSDTLEWEKVKISK
ncbi:MAG: hypothetical protein AAF571_12095 [Verrucomicrobiota bacterium]